MAKQPSSTRRLARQIDRDREAPQSEHDAEANNGKSLEQAQRARVEALNVLRKERVSDECGTGEKADRIGESARWE